MSRSRYKRGWKEFGSRREKTLAQVWFGWAGTWNAAGNGRFWKAKLSRARRKYYKLLDKGYKVKYPTSLETEVNYKSW